MRREIIAFLKRYKISQRAVARAIGVPQAYVSRYLAGAKGSENESVEAQLAAFIGHGDAIVHAVYDRCFSDLQKLPFLHACEVLRMLTDDIKVRK